MCTTCGCSGHGHKLTAFKPGMKPNETALLTVATQEKTPTSSAIQQAPPATKTIIELEQDILSHNNLAAARNRGYFDARNILTLNLVSSPGSGKTTLLERTLSEFKGDPAIYVIEGDQQTANDAERIAATGAPVVQINTGKGCHLDADMVRQALRQLQPAENSILMIENVGNLVCPSMFDLGESFRVVVISVTEGEDKPVKYPDMFHTAQICLINKIDLLPYLKFDLNALKKYALQVNPHLHFFEISAETGAGMDQWYTWLRNALANVHEPDFAQTV
jgi:hydrogenase nickel incorporation protein HypB